MLPEIRLSLQYSQLSLDATKVNYNHPPLMRTHTPSFCQRKPEM